MQVIKGFMGQTTAFRKQFLKSDVLIMGETKSTNEARYIHGKLGNGTWTFYGGHDPEDYQHKVGDPKTDLSLHPNSPGYRLILNNILFPAAKKKKLKTKRYARSSDLLAYFKEESPEACHDAIHQWFETTNELDWD